MRIITSVCACMVMLGGCSEAHKSKGDPAGTASSIHGKEIVAIVGPRTIRVEEVRRRMRADGMRAMAALHAIEREVLLAQEAERRGIGNRTGIRRAVEQAAVQEFLARSVEAEVSLEQINEGQVQAEYAAKTSQTKTSTSSELEALAEIRKEHLVSARFQHLGQMLRALRKAHASEVSPQADKHLAEVADL